MKTEQNLNRCLIPLFSDYIRVILMIHKGIVLYFSLNFISENLRTKIWIIIKAILSLALNYKEKLNVKTAISTESRSRGRRREAKDQLSSST